LWPAALPVVIWGNHSLVFIVSSSTYRVLMEWTSILSCYLSDMIREVIPGR